MLLPWELSRPPEPPDDRAEAEVKSLNPETYWTAEDLDAFGASIETPDPEDLILVESTPVEVGSMFKHIHVYVDGLLEPDKAVLRSPTAEVALVNIGCPDEE